VDPEEGREGVKLKHRIAWDGRWRAGVWMTGQCSGFAVRARVSHGSALTRKTRGYWFEVWKGSVLVAQGSHSGSTQKRARELMQEQVSDVVERLLKKGSL
jgi:hypothetical protein